MLKGIVIASVIAAAAVGWSYGSEANSKVNVVKQQPAGNGKQMYISYCASCHGMDGRGRGPVASSLKTLPSDLTLLRKNNRGEYPTDYVTTVLQNGTSVPAHGSTDMPVWGSIFAQMDGGQQSLTRKLRIANLTEYLRTIQAD